MLTRIKNWTLILAGALGAASCGAGLNDEELAAVDTQILAGKNGRSSSVDERLRRFSKSKRARKTVAYGVNHAGPSKGLCLRGVKKAMLHGGRYFKEYPSGAWAVNFGPQLKRVKFRNIYTSSLKKKSIRSSMKNIPFGCVVVYKAVDPKLDRNGKYGHIEIRTKNGFVSDYYSKKPRTGSWNRTSGRNRRVKAVYCKI